MNMIYINIICANEIRPTMKLHCRHMTIKATVVGTTGRGSLGY